MEQHGRDQRGFGHGQISSERSATARASRKPSERAEQGHRAGLCDQGEADPCQEQPAEVERHRWAERIAPTR